MASNSLSLEALKSHLFETIEGVKNLSDPEASDNEKISVEQAKQIVGIADSIIEIYKTQVEAVRTITEMDRSAAAGAVLEGMGIISKDNIKLIG